MRIRYNPKAQEEVENFDRFVVSKERLQELLKNNCKKLYIEIGMGKGDFITKMALQNEDVLFIGIEVSLPVLALAIRKLNRFEKENNLKIDNLYFMSFDAMIIDEMLES